MFERARRRSPAPVAFALAASAFVVAMIGTTLPTPLYPIYERDFGIAGVLIPVIFAVYAGGVIAGLLLFGHISDEIGRRRVLFWGLALSALSAAAFLAARSTAPLFIGRLLSGLSAGIFTGTATATLIDVGGPERRRLAAALAVAANTLGLGLGTLLAGLLAAHAPLPLRLPYAADLVLIALAAAAMLAVPETVEASGVGFRLRVAALRVPKEIAPIFVRAVIAGMCAFAVSGLFSAVVPSFLTVVLQRSNPALPGLIVFVLFAFTALGQFAIHRLPRSIALAIACGVLAIGTAILAAAVALQSLQLMFAAACVEGLGQGLAMGSGLAAINEKVSERRAEVSSTYFVMLYIALAIPVVGVGLLARSTSLPFASLVFCAAVGLAVLVVFATLVHPRADGSS